VLASAPGHEVYPYLLRGVAIEQPNHVWSTDITYLPMRGGLAASKNVFAPKMTRIVAIAMCSSE
jgi:putative transposase